MERPTDSRILIEDKGDIFIVTVPQRDYLEPRPQPQKFHWNWGSLLFLMVAGIGFTIVCVWRFGFIITIGIAGGMLVVLLIMATIDAIRGYEQTARKQSPPSSDPEDTGKARVVFYGNRYFMTEEYRWLYHPEMVPNWDDARHLGNGLFAVYIHRQYPPEAGASRENQADLWSYEIVCRTPEEAQWVLQEIETFLKRFDTSRN